VKSKRKNNPITGSGAIWVQKSHQYHGQSPNFGGKQDILLLQKNQRNKTVFVCYLEETWQRKAPLQRQRQRVPA